MSWLSSLRSSIVQHLPHGVRTAVRRRVNQTRWIESKIRKLLPVAAGGKIPERWLSARVLQVDDADALLRLNGSPLDPESVKACQANLARKDRFCTGVFANGLLVARGYCGELVSDFGLPGHWAFADFVLPKWRYRGIGQFLHLKRLAEAERRDIDAVFIFVSEINTPSLGACRAAGFVNIHAPDWSKTFEDSLRRAGAPPTRHVVLVHRR